MHQIPQEYYIKALDLLLNYKRKKEKINMIAILLINNEKGLGEK